MKNFTEKELTVKTLSELAAIYNDFATQLNLREVKKFSTKTIGIKRVVGIIKEYENSKDQAELPLVEKEVKAEEVKPLFVEEAENKKLIEEMKLENVELTENEEKLLIVIASDYMNEHNGDYKSAIKPDELNCWTNVEVWADSMKITQKSCKGILGSLCKKEVIFCDDKADDDNVTGFTQLGFEKLQLLIGRIKINEEKPNVIDEAIKSDKELKKVQNKMNRGKHSIMKDYLDSTVIIKNRKEKIRSKIEKTIVECVEAGSDTVEKLSECICNNFVLPKTEDWADEAYALRNIKLFHDRGVIEVEDML